MNINNPFFSIVIPTYNRSGTIGPAINSCLDQTFQDFELLIIDDGSIDDTRDVVAEYISSDARVKYFFQSNAGGAAARNHGIDVSSGKYIAFLDSDDKFLPTKLERFHEAITSQDDPCFVVASRIIVDRGVAKTWIKPPRIIRPDERPSDFIMADRGFFQTSALAVPKDIAKRAKFQQGLPFGQDTDFCLRLEKEGAHFEMLVEALTLWWDGESPDRVSGQKKHAPTLEWLDNWKGFISSRAYNTYLGFHVSRLAANESKILAWKLYFKALTSGKFSVKMAAVSFFQILLGRYYYRKLVNSFVTVFGRLK